MHSTLTHSPLRAYIGFGQFQVFADFEYFIFDELSCNFSDSNNHFHDFTSYLVTFCPYISQWTCLIDMRWCLYLKSNQINLAWNELIYCYNSQALYSVLIVLTSSWNNFYRSAVCLTSLALPLAGRKDMYWRKAGTLVDKPKARLFIFRCLHERIESSRVWCGLLWLSSTVNMHS